MVQWLFRHVRRRWHPHTGQLDIAGIFDLVCQVLGLTWPRLRGKIVNIIGEKNTERLEFVAKYVQQALVTGGFAGLWQQVQQDMSGGLWDMVVNGVKDWINCCWVRENAQRIFGLVQAVVDSISSIVAGNITGAANFIEADRERLKLADGRLHPAAAATTAVGRPPPRADPREIFVIGPSGLRQVVAGSGRSVPTASVPTARARRPRARHRGTPPPGHSYTGVVKQQHIS